MWFSMVAFTGEGRFRSLIEQIASPDLAEIPIYDQINEPQNDIAQLSTLRALGVVLILLAVGFVVYMMITNRGSVGVNIVGIAGIGMGSHMVNRCNTAMNALQRMVASARDRMANDEELLAQFKARSTSEHVIAAHETEMHELHARQMVADSMVRTAHEQEALVSEQAGLVSEQAGLVRAQKKQIRIDKEERRKAEYELQSAHGDLARADKLSTSAVATASARAASAQARLSR